MELVCDPLKTVLLFDTLILLNQVIPHIEFLFLLAKGREGDEKWGLLGVKFHWKLGAVCLHVQCLTLLLL